MIGPDTRPLRTSRSADGAQVHLVTERRPPKAADVDGWRLLEMVAITCGPGERWALVWDIQPHYPGLPWRVVLAKLRRLIRAGLLTGCTCGCRGDFEPTTAGLAALAAGKRTPPL